MVASLSQTLRSKVTGLSAGPEETGEAQLKKTVLLASSLIGIVVTFLWGMTYLLFREITAAFLSLTYTAITFLCVLNYYRTRRYQILLYSQLIMGLILPFLQSLTLGGFLNSGAVILWSLTSPLGALLLIGPKAAIRWWLAFLLLVFLNALLEPFLPTSNNLPPFLIRALFLGNITVVSSLAMLMLIYFVNQKNLAFKLLSAEQEKSESLLLNILPKDIAAILKNQQQTIAERFECASILFADMVGFTELTARVPPETMVGVLNEIYSHFDTLVEKYDLEKIRTIGDNYMVASGVPRPRPDHAQALAHLALEMNAYVVNHAGIQGSPISFRMGINSGPVVGGVVGRKKFVYDVWGDAVNIASRMESHGVPGKVHISQATYELIHSEFECELRGKVPIKGKGELETCFLVAPKQR
jgi:guanylate cyclase